MGNKVAVVQRILAQYREPIFGMLSRQEIPEPQYTFFSGKGNNLCSIKMVDPQKADWPVRKGGLRWKFIKTIKLTGNLVWQTGLIRLALSRHFGTIIFEGNPNHISTWVSCCLARLKGKRILMWSHGFRWNEQGPKAWIRVRFFRLADGMLLYGNRARQIMIGKGFNPEKLYVVYNSLDYTQQCRIREEIREGQLVELRKKLFKKPDLPVLLWIGRLTPQKKLHMILKAAKLLKNDGIECNILFVGDGIENKALVDLSRELRLRDNVYFYGACYQEKKLGLLISLADICVAPGEVGLTCMHALVYGTPVITHGDAKFQMPEYEAITEGESGAFFKRGSIEDLAANVEQWLRVKTSSTQISSACREIIDRYYNPNYQKKIINAAVGGVPASSGIQNLH